MQDTGFEKKELVESQLFLGKRDLAAAVLEDGISYTREEALAKVQAYEEKRIL